MYGVKIFFIWRCRSLDMKPKTGEEDGEMEEGDGGGGGEPSVEEEYNLDDYSSSDDEEKGELSRQEVMLRFC